MKISLSKPAISNAELKAAQSVLKSGWLTDGPKNEQFEHSFAKYVGTKHAQTINSCASALFIVLKALNIKGEVIIPSFTFVATANAVMAAGAKPVFADIDFESGNVTADTIKPLITSRTEAIMPVHFAGQSCQMDPIIKLCRKHKLVLIEDSAEAIGSTYKNKKTGSFGIGCFSFFPTKNITTGEGGMITTNDKNLKQTIKTMISHGIAKNTKTRYNWQREAVVAGFNLRMSNVLAAIGLEQLKKLNKLNNLRRQHARYLTAGLDKQIVIPPSAKQFCKHVYQMYTVKVDPKIRNRLVEKLKKVGIGASVHFSPPVHQQKFYKKFAHQNLKNTDKLANSILTLPMYPDLKIKELDYIINQTNRLTHKLLEDRT
ncbi:MAG: spore coat polysaccharide biosynthesis protein SpsC [Parcubacteria group bacterium]|nr:spore coat polysaccharide biosynthesis protein SpsC [Parcubacteria group bacterium]|tara:strand:+ start:468 stop:1586 length:1119 start_codon:yes stop_codon:yes gene_type:complete